MTLSGSLLRSPGPSRSLDLHLARENVGSRGTLLPPLVSLVHPQRRTLLSSSYPHQGRLTLRSSLRPQHTSSPSSSFPMTPPALASSTSPSTLSVHPSATSSTRPPPASSNGAPAASTSSNGATASTSASSPPITCSSGPSSDAFLLSVLGDLHLEPSQMPLFLEAQRQLANTLARLTAGLRSQVSINTEEDEAGSHSGGFVVGPAADSQIPQMIGLQGPSSELALGPICQLAEAAGTPRECHTYVVQLGDVGGYMNQPGSSKCFQEAVRFLDGFGFPRRSVLGNHDLEGTDFATDEENLAAWQHEFGQHHFWELDLGGTAVCLGLSTVRFRTAQDSCHEVYIDDEQFRWFQDKLKEHEGRPVFVFSHAPPMGSGLTSLQEVHVRNRCAWLNHSSECPQKFLHLLSQHPNVKLWFSGHFHLSHDYEGSVSRVGSCLFVQTGVMGGCHRDGRRHSRLLAGDGGGYRLMTLDHGTGEVRTDVVHRYANEALSLPPQRRWCSTLSLLPSCAGGGIFSPQVPSDLALRDQSQFPPASSDSPQGGVRWVHQGSSLLAVHANQILQYDPATRAPIGVVCDGVNAREIRLVLEEEKIPQNGSAQGTEESTEAVECEQREILAIELHPTEETEVFVKSQKKTKGGLGMEVIERNERGGFWQIYQVNRWHVKLKQAEEAREAAAAAAAASALPLGVPSA